MKPAKADKVFLAAICTGSLLYFVLLFSFPFLYDEFFYATIPYRLLRGDSLFGQEWHLSQLSSLFTYLPVWAWVRITGSADGLILFLRCIYLGIYIALAVTAYIRFRRYGNWAAAAVLLFFTQTPYRVLSLNYNSVYVICTLLLALCLLSLSEQPSPRASFAAGLCVGCCCVCNPLFAGVYLLYLILCAFRTGNSRHPVFQRVCVVRSLAGVSLIALLMLAFFFLTGGSIKSLLTDLPLILNSSEYGLGIGALREKLKTTYEVFSNISLGMPFLLPLMYGCMLADPKRYSRSHRCLYLILALIAGAGYIAGMYLSIAGNNLFPMGMFFSLPLLILTTTCYILTERKNRQLFCHMWLPCAVAALVQYMASNTMLTALGFVLAAANIPGVLFARDLYREMAENPPPSGKPHRFGRCLICGGLCLQLVFHIFVCAFGQMPQPDSVRADTGPCAGMILSDSQYRNYSRSISDMDYIRSHTPEDAPLLIVSYSSWMYLYADRPMATYTTWFELTIHPEHLSGWYSCYPERIPRYIYVDARLYEELEANLELLGDMFTFTTEELSQGFLLTVESYLLP